MSNRGRWRVSEGLAGVASSVETGIRFDDRNSGGGETCPVWSTDWEGCGERHDCRAAKFPVH